tara:strand:- start:945 stop:1079 length:135 start_codon:yes stop_codon:yes gene_type:complete
MTISFSYFLKTYQNIEKNKHLKTQNERLKKRLYKEKWRKIVNKF